MSKLNLQGCTPCAMQKNLKDAMCWLEELSQEITLRKSSYFSLICFSLDLTMRLMI
jgi:hypothetical protein